MIKGHKTHESHYGEISNLTHDFRNKNLNNLIASNIKGSTFLDIGAGTGNLILLAQKKGIDAEGIEPNQKLISLAKQIHGKDIRIKKLSAEKISTIHKKFNTIALIDVIEHIQDDTLILKEVKKILASSGRIILVTSAFQFLYGKRDKQFGHFRRYSKEELKNKLIKSGYIIENIRYWNMIGFFPYFFYEKILGKSLISDFRSEKNRSLITQLVYHILNTWFWFIENNFNFGFGLTLFVIARNKNE